MIDIDEMEKWCIGAISEHCSEINAFSSDEVIELITRLREAEKDAARYRWLRDESDYEDFEFFESLEKDRWNYEIDELMKEKGDE